MKNFFKKFLISNTDSSILGWAATLVLSLLLLLSVVTIAFVAVLRDREVEIPQRFADKIISEVNSISSTYLIEASSVHLSLDEGFSPEIKITNVDLSISDKEPVLSFNSLTTKFSLVDLISGKFRVSSVTLDSANLSIVRKHDGFFNLKFGAENIAGADSFDASPLLER